VCVLLLVIGLIAVFLLSAIRIVPEHQRLVILRLGRYMGVARGPGLVFVIPIVDTPITVDLREKVQQVPHQTAITKDNASISLDFLIYWQVVDPVQSVVQVRNFVQASQGIATTTLRAVIGDILLANVMTEREHIQSELCARLDEATQRWGVRVRAIEIREIVLPKGAPAATASQGILAGARGKVGQALMPAGTVLIELNAVADELLTTGEEVVVTGMEGTRLRVARATWS
jgi:regulator of protease activity HflC (stomatin/prohibitin superfamily)